MSDVKQVVDRYVSIWNETDPGRRRELIAATRTEDGTCIDPLLSGDGHTGFDAMIQGGQDHYAKHPLKRTSVIDADGDRVRFERALVTGTIGATLAAGLDVGQLAQDGRFQSIAGFIDQAPAPRGEG